MNPTNEKIKNVFICVLLAGMLYLTYSVWFFDSPFEAADTDGLFGISQNNPVSDAAEGKDLDVFGIRPLGVLVRNGEILRGAIYNSAKCDEIYKQLRKDIAGVMEGAKATETVDEAEWERALSEDGVFLDYYGNIPVEAMKLWLGGTAASGSACGRYYMFSTAEKNVTVYVKNSLTDAVYRISTSSNSEEFAKLLSGVSADPASLAVEREEEDFRALLKETIVVDGAIRLPAIAAHNLYENFRTSIEKVCLEAFGLYDVSPSTYSEADGTAVYIADMVTLKISPSGIATYSDPRGFADETLGLSVDSQGELPTLAEKVESARSLCESIAKPLPGSGGIYIMSIGEIGGRTEILFGRHVGGVPVNMNGSVCFARVEIKDSYIRSANVNFRGYDVTAQNTDVLSVRIAAAAVNGAKKTGDMRLCYNDDGAEAISPVWFINEKAADGKEDGDELVES